MSLGRHLLSPLLETARGNVRLWGHSEAQASLSGFIITLPFPETSLKPAQDTEVQSLASLSSPLSSQKGVSPKNKEAIFYTGNPQEMAGNVSVSGTGPRAGLEHGIIRTLTQLPMALCEQQSLQESVWQHLLELSIDSPQERVVLPLGISLREMTVCVYLKTGSRLERS